MLLLSRLDALRGNCAPLMLSPSDELIAAPALVTLMVGAGALLAFMTAPCWWQVLSFAA